MSPRNIKPTNAVLVRAANQLQQLKTRINHKKVSVHLHPPQFSEEAFEWHRTSLMTSAHWAQLKKPTDSVLWYLNSQQEYFNQVKVEVTGKCFIVAPAPPANSEAPVCNPAKSVDEDDVTQREIPTESLQDPDSSSEESDVLPDPDPRDRPECDSSSRAVAAAPPANSETSGTSSEDEDDDTQPEIPMEGPQDQGLSSEESDDLPDPECDSSSEIQENLHQPIAAAAPANSETSACSSGDSSADEDDDTQSKSPMEGLQDQDAASSEESDVLPDPDSKDHPKCDRRSKAIQENLHRPITFPHVLDEGHGDFLQLDYEEDDIDDLIFDE